MKVNEAPKKIYRTTTYLDNNRGKTVWKVTPVKGAENIEYIRKDAFIENVCDWLSDTLQTVVDVNIPSMYHVESILGLGIITQTEFIENFKKEIEYLLD